MVVERRGSACAEMQERLVDCQALPLNDILKGYWYDVWHVVQMVWRKQCFSSN